MPVTKKHDFTKKEIIAGTIVLVAAAVFIGFVLLIQGWRPAEETRTYHAQFAKVIGLKNSAEVRFGGMIAGKVTSIAPDPEDRSQIRVSVAVRPDMPVNAESIATIETVSLTSDFHLEISTGDAEAALLPEDGMLKSVTKSGGFVDIPNMDGLISGSEDLVGDLRDLLGVEKAKEAEAAGEEELASMAVIMSDMRRFLGIEDAVKTEEAGGTEMASLTRITQDLRDFLGVQEAKAEEAAGEGEGLIVLPTSPPVSTACLNAISRSSTKSSRRFPPSRIPPRSCSTRSTPCSATTAAISTPHSRAWQGCSKNSTQKSTA